MIILAGLIIGAIVGATLAIRKKGNRLDIAQYAGVVGIMGALVGLLLTVVIERLI